MSIIHWIAIGIAFVLLAVLGYLMAVTWIERHQADQVNAKVPYASRASLTASRVAVVYFSRSGNTALAARHVAQRLNAQLYPLEAPDYQLGLPGLVNAAKDANARKSDPALNIDISPRTIDLRPFDTVYLGSPVWLYSPAPPIWAFVEHNRFDGKHVVLFNTFNSHIGQDHIEAFKAKVLQRGARSFEHRHVLRGRMTQQLTPEEMLRAIDAEWFSAQPAAGTQYSR